MNRTTDKPKAAGKPATAKKGAAPKAAARTRGTKLVRGAAPRSVAAPRPPSLAEARRRMQAGRTFWDDLTPEQRAAGLDGPEVSGRAPTLARPRES